MNIHLGIIINPDASNVIELCIVSVPSELLQASKNLEHTIRIAIHKSTSGYCFYTRNECVLVCFLDSSHLQVLYRTVRLTKVCCNWLFGFLRSYVWAISDAVGWVATSGKNAPCMASGILCKPGESWAVINKVQNILVSCVLRSRIHCIEKFSAHANSSSLDWRQHSSPSVCSMISLIQLQWDIPCRLLPFSYFRPKSGVSPVLNTDTEWLTWIWLMVSCRIPCWQSCQLSRILRETHAFLHNLTITHIITSISRTKHLHVPLYGTESGRGNQRHNSRATKDRDSAVDDCVEGPSAMIKQKIKDSGSLRKWSGVAIIVYI